MATEKRLIDANALECNFMFLRKMWSETEICSVIEKAPTVDAVVIPCKIGDEVWAIRNYNGVKHPQKGFVSDMLFTRDMKLQIVVKHIARGEWGKAVFATYEEAAEAIGERKDNGI